MESRIKRPPLNLKIIAAILVGVALLLFFRETRRYGSERGEKPQSTVAEKPSVGNKGRPPLKVEPTATQLAALRDISASFNTGLQTMGLDLSEGAKLPVTVAIELRCSVGDADAILQELKHSSPKRMLLTVEALARDSSFKPVVREVSEAEIAAGFKHEFQLPPVKKPTQVGLFLCKDTKSEGRCNGKPVRTIDAVFEDYIKLGKKQKTYVAPDNTYFFNYLLLTPKGLSAMTSSVLKPDQYDKLQTYVAKLGTNGDAAEGFSRTRTVNGALASVTPKLESGAMTIVLPKIKEECNLDLKKIRRMR